MSSRNKSNVKKIFELWCEVKRVHGSSDDAKVPTGIIVESFPESYNEAKTIADIPAFAFPCEFESESVQSYSFVLTTDDSKWRFGFCRYDPKTDSAMVLVTHLPWHDTFLRLLTVLAELRRSNHPDFREFLNQTFIKGVPEPGGYLKICYNAGQSCFVFERPLQFQLPSIPENHNLSLYYNFADPKNMIAVFAAMLAERRIIFTSRRLDRLSSCIQAANAFLYPMVWQHIFIPVLPMKLKDYLSAPMPYLVGVAESVLDMMMPEELGDVVIFNCDRNIFESPFDDVNELPTEIVSQLKKQLSQTHEHIGDRVSKIFLGVLVQLIGGYRDAVEFRDTGKTFNREKFIHSRPSNLRPFLTKMMELQIFQQFIDERLQMLNTGLGFSDEFEIETVRYAEKMKRRGRGNIFKNVKEKTNPAVKSAVKSVKDSSKGIKTYYIGLKTKFRDVTPPATTSHSAQFRSHLSTNMQHSSNHVKLNNTGHHSAPSSPVCNKRNVTVMQHDSPEITNTERPYQQYLCTSSSAAHVFTTNGHKSCAASSSNTPKSSISSDMNLSQELEDHPLFKPPIVDRSLKMCKSLETQQHVKTTPTTTAASISLSRQKPVMGSGVRKYRQQTVPKMAYYTQSTHNMQKIIEKEPQNMPKMQATTTTKGIHNLERNCWKNYANSDEQSSSSNTSVSSTSASLLSSSSITSDSNVSFVSVASNISKSSLIYHNHLQQQQQQQQQQEHQQKQPEQLQPPVPLPRLRKEKYREMNYNKNNPPHSSQMTYKDSVSKEEQQEENKQDETDLTKSKDLIYLDDFDWEDFDPLNKNARPLPMMTRNLKISTLPQKQQTTLNSNNILIRQPANLNEPLLSAGFLKPPPLPKTLPPTLPLQQNNDDDFELLRKYGLDQFTLPASSSTEANSSCHIVTKQLRDSGATGRSNWTTFD